MKKYIIFLMIFISFLMFIDAREFFFRDYKNYDCIEYFYYKGYINIDINDLPIKSESLIKEIKYLIENIQNNRIYLNETDKIMLKRLYEDVFRDEIFSINDKLNFNCVYEDTFYYYFNNIFNLSLNGDYYFLDASGITYYPYEINDINVDRYKDWNGTVTIINKGYGGFFKDNNFLILGRFQPAWGQGVFDNLFLSRNTYAYDGILLNLQKSYIKFTYFSTKLTPNNVSFRNDSVYSFASFHKLSFNLILNTKMSFKEIIIYSAKNVELQYFNPFVMYYMTQWNIKSDDNIIWSLEFSNNLINNVPLDIEIFIDDYQYDNNAIGGPNKLGYICNIGFNFNNVFIKSEYVRILKWTGTHEYDELKYSYYDQPIMYFIGPDADLIGIKVDYYREFLHLFLNTNYIRKGEGNIDVSYESEGGTMYPEFPSGLVEKTWNINLGFEYKINSNISILGSMEHTKISNENNIIDNNSNITKFKLTGEIRI